MADFSTTGLLTRQRLKAGLTSSETDYTAAVLLDIADQQLADIIVPAILNTNGDYYLIYEDYSLTESRRKYPIPSRSFNGRLHSLYWLNTDKDQHRFLGYIDQRDAIIGQDGYPTRHTINDNSIVLYHAPSNSTEYLRVYYHYAPSVLVTEAECMAVTAVNTSTGQLDGTPPGSWSTADTFDIVSSKSPFELINVDLTASAVGSGSVTFTASDLDTNRLASGSFVVTLAGETCYPMIPQQMHYVLADLAACPILEQVRDDGWSAKKRDALERTQSLIRSIIPRKETELKQWFAGQSHLEFRCL